MTPNQIFNVKQAAEILGLSTNTTYKYLKEGKIEAARGQKRGTFRIPKSSLEKFLGSSLNESQIEPIGSPLSSAPLTSPISNPGTQSLPTLALRVSRMFLSACLILLIFDIILNPNFSLSAQVIRMSIIAIFILLSYQFGGFIKK